MWPGFSCGKGLNIYDWNQGARGLEIGDLEETMNLRGSITQFGRQIRTLQGEPHYIALGMAIGVFAAITPTVPLQTVMAVTLALVFKASKPAAIMASLVANPITIPIFYVGSYKLGALLSGGALPKEIRYESVLELLQLGAGVTIALLTGGVLLGLAAGSLTYVLALKFFQVLHAHWKTGKADRRVGLSGANTDQSTLPE